jgi:hypothetical protein
MIVDSDPCLAQSGKCQADLVHAAVPDSAHVDN